VKAPWRMTTGPGAEGEGAPAWAITYGDLMSLLLVFFVLLASYSNVDAVKYRSLVGSLREAFGSRDRTLDDAHLDSSPTQGIASAGEEAERRWVEREVDALAQDLGGPLQMQKGTDGIRLRIEGQVLFDLGKAELRPEARDLLSKLSPILRRYPYSILVEGHTDDLPIHNSEFPSNWELSASRAANVVRYFIAEGGVPPARFAAIGYADTRPLVPNRDDRSRRINRRVEFLLSQPVPGGGGESPRPTVIPSPIGGAR
jgi:chemotaxis protein MotB